MNKRKIILIVLAIIIIYSCGDPCNEGYSQVTNPDGSTYCLPDFLEGKINEFKLGDTYYHSEYGVIRVENDVWKNDQNNIVEP